MSKIGIIGCGAWALTQAKLAAENGHSVTLWCHEQSIADTINSSHRYELMLPDVALPSTIQATAVLKEAITHQDYIISGIASPFISIYDQIKTHYTGQPLLSLTKGLVPNGNGEIISNYIQNKLPNCPYAVLSGPNLAKEIAKEKPAATVIASRNNSAAKAFQTILNRPYFRIYTSPDPIGVELGGVLKNGYALAAGMIDGLKLGDNAKAAFITRSLKEMIRFATHYGCQSNTFYGLSGLGDLMATCSSSQSRNWQTGYALCQGENIDSYLAKQPHIAEGVKNTPVIIQIAKENNIDMPILSEIHAILLGQKTPQEAVSKLMQRPVSEE